MERIYAITTTKGDIWGIPAEVIAGEVHDDFQESWVNGEHEYITRHAGEEN